MWAALFLPSLLLSFLEPLAHPTSSYRQDGNLHHRLYIGRTTDPGPPVRIVRPTIFPAQTRPVSVHIHPRVADESELDDGDGDVGRRDM